MQWTADAETAIKKVPFFVRRKVRARVEKEALTEGKTIVTLNEVKKTQARYLTNMEEEIKGFRVETCFGPGGCPNRAIVDNSLAGRIEFLLEEADLLSFLKERVHGGLKFHHEFRVAVADCPNACSQPQIRDVGIIGACRPRNAGESCSGCGACIETCREEAIRLESERETVSIDACRCLACGRCVEVCPAGALAAGEKGFRVQLGGKLGRRPVLARELPGIHTPEEVLRIIEDCLALYKSRSRKGERFAELFGPEDYARMAARHPGR